MYDIEPQEYNANNFLKKSSTAKQPLIITVSFELRKLLEIRFEPKTIFKIITLLVIILVVISTVGQMYKYILADGNENILIKLFYLNNEKNLPTAYSSLSLLFCSLLLAVIAINKHIRSDRYRFHWTTLSLIFLYLSVDEAISIHEKSIETTRNLLNTTGFFYYAWIIPVMFLLVIFILFYLKFIKRLPQKTRFLFLFAGMLFIVGALGIEMIGAKIYVMQNKSEKNLIYAMVATLEETLEMMGTTVFIYALLDYIKKYIRYSNLQVVLKR
ncbi:hypothetical protein [Myxosarcina sp. GI1]|uniref:hypothetical protein n=1 Tax=Myxosarcina sp. GI1 TaxID=1541065 RepID=UPI00068A80FC|nr:hypothetical protein [Myxosarcina sp. GI1]